MAKKKRTYYPDNLKIEVVTYYLKCGRNLKDTSYKYNIQGQLITKWTHKFGHLIDHKPTKIEAIKEASEVANIKLEAQKEKSLQGIFEVQDLAIEKAKELIPKEKDLNKILKAFELTLKITNPEINPEDDKSHKSVSIIEQVNNFISNGK